MHRLAGILAIGAAAAGMAPACSSDSTSTGAQPLADAGHEGGSRPVDPFNGDCESARWADVSDECWSCACTACKPTLDLCDTDCIDVLNCSFDKHTLVNVGADLGCEIRATITECLNNPTAQAVARALTDFDGCLMRATKPAGRFRACEVECGIPYSGDVCQRYPEAPPADGG